MSGRCLEVLRFQHSTRYTTFTTDENGFKNKVVKNSIEVIVMLDLECVDMSGSLFED